MDIQIGNHIYYGQFGLGEVIKVETIDNQKRYTLQCEGLQITFFEKDFDKKGLRKLADKETALKALNILSEKREFQTKKNWNQRQKEYTDKISKGNLIEIAEIFASLNAKEKVSYMEKMFKETCKKFVLKESQLLELC